MHFPDETPDSSVLQTALAEPILMFDSLKGTPSLDLEIFLLFFN